MKNGMHLNFLPQNASTVGLIDLKIIPQIEEEKKLIFSKAKKWKV